MSTQVSGSARRHRSTYWQLVNRHSRQIIARSDQDWQSLTSVAAVTFRPGDSTSHFSGKLLRQAGAAVAVVLAYEENGTRLSISGYRARVQAQGLVTYGRDGDREFCYDGRQPPTIHGTRNRLSAKYNPTMTELLLRADAACWRVKGFSRLPPAIPEMPRILLGFAPCDPPEFEVTPALKRLAACQIGIPLQKLEANPRVLAEKLLRDLFEQQLWLPAKGGNTTGLLLVDAELCTQAHRALRVFEDFRRLVGVHTWNPARAVEILCVDNPAGEVLERHGIDPAGGFDQPIPEAVIASMEQEMRNALGGLAPLFSQEDLFDGLTEPTLPIWACSRDLQRLRAQLTPYWSECTSDSDLRSAARRPDKALYASGACQVQVLHRPDPKLPLRYGPDNLGRRLKLDWQLLPSPHDSDPAIDPTFALSVA